METRRSLRLDQKRKDQKSESEEESWNEKNSSNYSSKRRKSSIVSEIDNVATTAETVMRQDTFKDQNEEDKEEEDETPPKVPTSKHTLFLYTYIFKYVHRTYISSMVLVIY